MSFPGRGRLVAVLFAIRRGKSLKERFLNFIAAIRHPGVFDHYVTTFGRAPNLADPTYFTEKIAHRKAYDRNPLFAIFCDKLASREYVEARAPTLKLPQLLWSGNVAEELPSDLVPPFVLKPNNASGRLMLVRNAEQWSHGEVVKLGRAWLNATPYAKWAGEWGYSQVPPFLMVESFLPSVGRDERPIDYRFYVFEGRVAFIYVTAELYGSAPRRGVFDVDWQPMPWDRFKRGKRDCLNVEFSRPAALAAMIAAAETLATGTDFLRVDLYDIEGVPYFGEFAAYPHSGLASFVPADTSENENEIELEHGRLWP